MPDVRRTPIEDLRLAIDCLPLRTRRAMLDGIRSHDIIVGAYSDRLGGVCPMLAAHRCGGRTSFIGFARAWDRFASSKRARRATGRELRVLEGQLTASLLAVAADAPAKDGADLGAIIAEHQLMTRERRAREAALTGGWAFLRGRRERRDAVRALTRVEATGQVEDERERELV